MNISLEDKVTVITGGTRGIGLSIAKVFGENGSKIAICGRSESNINHAIKELEADGIEVLGMKADVSNEKELINFADEVEKKYGGIDIWINNAGIYPLVKMLDMSLQDWEQLFDINVKSVFIGSKIAKEKLMKRKGGVIINAASFASIMPSVTAGAYAATKSAVYSMTKSLAAELAPHNIRVLGYIPGVIDTEMNKKLLEKNNKAIIDPLAMKRAGTVEEVAYPLLFLASEYASYITGTFIEISGGKFCVQNPSAVWE
ncbi:SDR family oxidoreductase [Irregularibacter muris]|uniref:SDR family oxidoreductase n=1 Tax=Irregularibacter muris TaxID=1796619 RepID=A0AAE3HF23_9FIRM|nr:SDR family NAD(P)-dependent oxidoreductase [Irregularibacter muris]MCR1899365.1 SDR family oxidoreductase [Irregularibacter muris]